MTQFFLAYKAYNSNNTHNEGFRLFEEGVSTTTEIASMINRHLDEIAEGLGVTRSKIIATAFNKV